jgi:hypothetical protein
MDVLNQQVQRNQAFAQQQQAAQNANYMNAYAQMSSASHLTPPKSPTTINCSTFGSKTACTGW